METYEQRKLLDAMDRWITAFEEKDGDAAYEVEKEVIGFGWRSPNFRDRSQVSEADFKRGIKRINDSIQSWHGSYESLGIRIIGNTGLLCGILTEEITELDGSVRAVRVRYSSTWMRFGGEWRQVMGHRDAQFDNP